MTTTRRRNGYLATTTIPKCDVRTGGTRTHDRGIKSAEVPLFCLLRAYSTSEARSRMTKASQHKLLKGFCLYLVGTARFELATPSTPFRVKQNQSPAKCRISSVFRKRLPDIAY